MSELHTCESERKREREGGRGEQAAWLRYHVIVQFVVHRRLVSFSSGSSDVLAFFPSSRSPLRGLVRFLLFYTVSYFALSEEQDGDDDDLSYPKKWAVTYDFLGYELS